jgi:hypothetical protein
VLARLWTIDDYFAGGHSKYPTRQNSFVHL